MTTKHERPLSPHLQIYKPQLTSMMSIFHRATGAALALGLLLLVCWLSAAASGIDAYNAVRDFLGSTLGHVLLFGWSWALFYHLCNGIRHLFWDMGFGFKLKNAYMSGYAVLFMSAALTVATWLCVCYQLEM